MHFLREIFDRRRIQAAALALVVATPLLASARGTEPNTIDPNKDAAYIQTIGLDSADWNDPIVNILIVGQDAQPGTAARHTRPNGEQVDDLSTHADSNMLLSFNKSTGIVSILSVYRGYLVSAEQWADVPNMPAAASDRYLANYYREAGRAKYVAFTRSVLETFIRSRPSIQSQFFVGGRLKIHGLMETGFSGFKAAMSGFTGYLKSSLSVASSTSSQLWPLAKIFANHDELLAELRSQGGYEVMTDLRKSEVGQDASRTVLGQLRERQRYPAGGYQRAFNHAKFISYALGFVGSFMADGDLPNFLREPAIVGAFNGFSRTFSLDRFDSSLRRSKDGGLHMIARTGFKGGTSPIYIVQIGTTTAGYAVYRGGRAEIVDGTGHIQKLKPEIQLIPKPNDCRSCPR